MSTLQKPSHGSDSTSAESSKTTSFALAQLDEILDQEGSIAAADSQNCNGEDASETYQEYGPLWGLDDHLVVLVHGVSGVPECFDVLLQTLRNHLDGTGVVLTVSKVNRREGSHEGVASCGLKLAEEVKELIRCNPTVKNISFVAYSIGGLFVRYACGVNFDVESKKIFGLEPCNFLSIATPHLGCDVQGASQVPFIGWGLRVPMLDMILRPIFSLFAAPVTRLMYGKSGANLFLEEDEVSTSPVILNLVHDIPEEGYFFTALAQFKSRVCYANAVGDALVGWANASLRKVEDLPQTECERLEHVGIVHEAPLKHGSWLVHQNATQGESIPTRHIGSAEDFPFEQNAAGVFDKQVAVEHMLSRLQSLPWCRIDIAIKNTFMAHTNIIVAKRQLDSIGMPIVEHIAYRFSELSTA